MSGRTALTLPSASRDRPGVSVRRMVFDSLSAAIRTTVGKAHPVPIKRLVDFERVTVAAGAEADVKFSIPKEALSLTTADGSKKLYSGSHELVFSRGNGEDTTVAVTV